MDQETARIYSAEQVPYYIREQIEKEAVDKYIEQQYGYLDYELTNGIRYAILVFLIIGGILIPEFFGDYEGSVLSRLIMGVWTMIHFLLCIEGEKAFNKWVAVRRYKEAQERERGH